jgi:pSer/pThr/pTyr-binding forkhead associated (FHA) protein
MIVECPHCGANYTVDENRFASASQLQGQCQHCHSSFKISPPPGIPQLPAGQTVALAVIEGPARGQVFRLSQARVVLGRSRADIVVYDPEVSRKHCVVEVHGPTATLTDLGTSNGTFVAGKSIQTSQLEHLSKFRIGATTLLFTVTDNRVGESEPPPTLVVRSRRG